MNVTSSLLSVIVSKFYPVVVTCFSRVVYQPNWDWKRNYAGNDFVTVELLWWADLLSGKGNGGHAVASVSLR